MSGKATTEDTARESKFANSLPDWAARLFFFVVFLYFGGAKFNSGANAPWTEFFKEVGLGQWLRYLTGVLEVIGAILVLAPQTVSAGLGLLMCVTSGAVLVVTLELHKPREAVVAFALLCAMIAFWMHRRRA